jgi:hypothetical protein
LHRALGLRVAVSRYTGGDQIVRDVLREEESEYDLQGIRHDRDRPEVCGAEDSYANKHQQQLY